MNIEIRIWDAEEKKMYYSFEKYFGVMKSGTVKYFIEEGRLFVGKTLFNGDWTEPKILLFTGFYDVKGKKIYEGDIVKYRLRKTDKNYRTGKIIWQSFRGSFAIEDSPYANSDLFHYVRNGNTVKVIGNIYKNPELLK